MIGVIENESIFTLIYNILVNIANKAGQFWDSITDTVAVMNRLEAFLGNIITSQSELTIFTDAIILMIYLSCAFIAIDIARDLI